MIPRFPADTDVARAFIRRAPHALPAWGMLGIALHYALAPAYNLVTGSLGLAWEVTPAMALRWGLLSCLVSLQLVACLPVLSRLRAWIGTSPGSRAG
ncbi:hypothetical protein D3C86_1186830 [compost metagenome]